MPTVDIECAECGHKLQVEKALLGTTMKCPKCKFDFVVEPAGAYGLAGDDDNEELEDFSESDETLEYNSPRAPKKSAPQAETEAQRKLRERMERWAGSEE